MSHGDSNLGGWIEKFLGGRFRFFIKRVDFFKSQWLVYYVCGCFTLSADVYYCCGYLTKRADNYVFDSM